MNLQAYIALGWSPILANATTNGSVIQEVVGWAGGNGTAPTTGVYIGSNGFVTNITDGVNIAGGAGGGGAAISAFNSSQNTGTVSFANSNGISFGLNNGTMTATVATNYQSQGAYLTTAMASNAGSNFMGTNTALTANGVSMTANSSGLSLNFPAFLTTAQPVGAYLTTARASNDGIGLNTALTANGVSWTVNSSGISLNVPAFLTTAMASNASTQFVQANAVFAGTNASGTIASNGISISVAAPGGGGNTMTVSAANGSYSSNAITFANSNGVSFSTGTQGIYATVATNYQSQGAYLTTAALSGDTSKYFQNWKLTGNTSGTTSSAQGTDFWLAGGNGVTVSGSSNTISFSVATNYQSQGAYLTTAMASNAGSNFMGTNTALTANGVSVTANSSGLSLNFPAFLTTADLSANSSKYFQNWKLTGNTAGTTSSGQGTDFWLAGGNGVTVSGSSNTISISVATNYQSQGAYLTTARASTDGIGLNTAQTNVTWTVNSSGLSFNAGGYAGTGTTFAGANISGSMTHNTNGLNLSLSVAAPGGGGAINVTAAGSSNNVQTLQFGNNAAMSFGLNGSTITGTVSAYTQSQFTPPWVGLLSFDTLGNGTMYVDPIQINDYISASQINHMISMNSASTTNNSTYNMSYGYSWGIYSRNVSTLSLATSASFSTSFSNSSNINLSLYSGWRLVSMTAALNITPGDYWIAQAYTSASAGQNSMSMSHFVFSNYTGAFMQGVWGVGSGVAGSTSLQYVLGQGILASNTSAMPNSIGFNQIKANGQAINFRYPYFNLVNFTA